MNAAIAASCSCSVMSASITFECPLMERMLDDRPRRRNSVLSLREIT
jgi:hypothetical protein